MQLDNPKRVSSAWTVVVIERLLLGLGAALVLGFLAVILSGYWRSSSAVVDFESRLAVPDQELWSVERKTQYLASLAEDLSLPLAIVRLPRLDLEVPLFDSVTEANLNRGVARIDGTATLEEADNMGIAGHRDGYFRVLKDVVVGDTIEMTTATGVRRYEVSETFVVEPDEVWVLEPGDSAELTLVTCYPFYFIGSAPQRFIVRAHLRAGV